jgi:hypothetical protein
MDALKLCLDNKRPLPPWLAREIWGTLVHLYNKPRNRERFETMTARSQKHYNRWATVQSFRDERAELAAFAATLRESDDHPLHGFKPTWDAVFEYAAKELGEGEAAVEKGYKQVQRAFKSGEVARFFVADFRRPLGRSRVRKPRKKP